MRVNGEVRMTGILDKFHVEYGTNGARVLARTQPLTGLCLETIATSTRRSRWSRTTSMPARAK